MEHQTLPSVRSQPLDQVARATSVLGVGDRRELPDYLSFAGLCFRPAPQLDFEFFFPTDQSGQAGRVQSFVAALDRAWPQRRLGVR
jgi:hypothetical protein